MKLTDERLAAMNARIDRACEGGRETFTVDEVAALLAHIAALTVERDDAVSEREQVRADYRAARDERDNVESEARALRERVQALEKQVAEERQQHNQFRAFAEERIRADGHRLFAILQRAGDVDGLGRACAEGVAAGRWDETKDAEDRDAYRDMGESVACYVMGEDATGAPASHEPIRIPTVRLLDGPNVRRHEPKAPEPSTAEAFATVRDALPFMLDGSGGKAARGRAALSLLERRMGAMGRALRRIDAWDEFPRVPDGQNPGQTISYGFAYGSSGERDYMRRVARAALTDAPPVVTLEEVEALGLDLLVCTCDVQYGQSENHHETCSGRTVRERLTALRRVP